MPEEQRFVLGIAYQAGPDPRITKGADGGRDYFTKAELEKAAWSFMRNGPRMNAFHVEGTEDCAQPVESFIWRWDDWDAGDGIVVKDGDWLLGSVLSPRMWDAKKAGKIRGYSPEGTARRRRVAKEEGVVPIAKAAAGLEGDEDELTALSDADMTKVALVGAGANGIPRFLISKDADAAGLLDPEFVRELIGKQAEPEPDERGRAVLPSGITVSGSPADIAAFIHKAAVRAETGNVAKAEMSSKGQNDLPDSDFAYIEPGGKKDDEGKTTPRSLRHFPINDAAHVRNALARLSSSPFGDKASGKVHAAAKKFGIQVSKEACVAEPVTKADLGPELDGGVDGMDPTVALAEPEEMGPGDMTDPGSPAWESIDAATAAKWCSILSRSKVAVGLLAEREMLEAASADPDDAENAWDLQDACCAIDYAISVLAPFAVAEQSEADCGADAMEAIGKAAEGLESVPLAAVEGLCAVAKSGRVLSGQNEAHIREAAARLNTVLSSLPSAPTADDGQPVAKMTPETEADMPKPSPSADATAASGQEPAMGTAEPPVTAQEAVVTKAADEAPAAEPVAKSALTLIYDRDGSLAGVANADSVVQRVTKADSGTEGKTTMQAVFDENGNLVGIVDPADITPVAGAGGKPDATDDSAADAAPDASDMTPQPPAEAGAPAEDVAKQATQNGTITVTQDVLKSIAHDAALTALEAQGAAHAEVVAKMAADNAGLAEELGKVTARLETVEKQDARPGVFTSGQVPPEGTIPPPRPSLRGQDQGASPVIDVAKAREMKQRMYTADPAEANRIATEMNRSAIAALEAIHSGARQ